MKSSARGDTWSRLNVRMVFVFFLEEVQGYWAVGFAFDELLHLGIGAVSDFIGRSLGDNAAASKHNHPRGDAKSARHVVRDDHRGHVAAVSKFERQLIDHRGHDWIESRGRFIAKQQLGIERERARQANPFFHSAANFIRFQFFKSGQSNHLKFLFHDPLDLVGGFVSVLQKWQRNILAHRKRGEQRPGLEQHSEPYPHPRDFTLIHRCDGFTKKSH